MAECHLLSGTFSWCVQGVLGITTLGTLLYKRAMERPRRSLLIWFMDVSKQVCGGALDCILSSLILMGFGGVVVHVWNIALSIWIAWLRKAEEQTGDECALYFINYTLDISMGTVFVWWLLVMLQQVAVRFKISSLQRSGDYGTPPSCSIYMAQLMAFLGILIFYKTFFALIVLFLASPLEILGEFFMGPIQGHPNVELVVVMIVCPWLMNTFQFWVLDSVIMHKGRILEHYEKIGDTDHSHHGSYVRT
ncbi:unnamed protein product [Discosporangium mesarthrocarpum]